MECSGKILSTSTWCCLDPSPVGKLIFLWSDNQKMLNRTILKGIFLGFEFKLGLSIQNLLPEVKYL